MVVYSGQGRNESLFYNIIINNVFYWDFIFLVVIALKYVLLNFNFTV